MGKFTIQEKLDVVAQWETSGASQDAFLRDHPSQISSRTLRSWIGLLRRPQAFLERQHEVVARAVAEWTAIQAAMAGTEAVEVEIQADVPMKAEAHAEPPPAPPPPAGRLAMPPAYTWIG